MNLEQKISELQERNRKRLGGVLLATGAKELDIATTDTAHAVALAVIGEMKTYVKKDMWPTADVQDLLDHLTTLEEALQDKK